MYLYSIKLFNAAPDSKRKSQGYEQLKMTVLEKSEKARQYYEGYSSKTLVSGFEKIVCTDGEKCMFVNSDYEPVGEEVVFKCDTRRFNIGVQLYKPRQKNN